jgi:predicted HNH restriction endonuclease
VSCFICGFNFSDVYGEIGQDFIHVHHLRQLADIGEEYEVDPVADLRPVCPNCHAIIHRRIPALTIEEVKALLHRVNRKTG